LRIVSKPIEMIRPNLHHLDTFVPELRGMHVGAANVILFHVSQLPLDRVGPSRSSRTR
jgi:hypothetical protein